MKAKQLTALCLCTALLMAGCAAKDAGSSQQSAQQQTAALTQQEQGEHKTAYPDAVQIVLADDAITVDGEAISGDDTDAVYAANALSGIFLFK